jgi:hypothetical protein
VRRRREKSEREGEREEACAVAEQETAQCNRKSGAGVDLGEKDGGAETAAARDGCRETTEKGRGS